MDGIQLSICIATLNRAAFIGETLESIVTQLTDEVEIVVVDGASTDQTGEIVKSFAARFPRLRYLRLEQKGGVDQDYCKTVDMARGEYCWLFPDDDLLKPGAVAAVLAATRKNYSLIVVNAEVRSVDLSACLQPSRVRFTEDRIYATEAPARNQLLADVGNYLSFIGGVVIRRDIWNQREKERYLGTVFIHLGVLFQSPLPGNALAIAHPWITIRYGNALWKPQSFKIWMFNFPELVWSFQDYEPWARQKVSHRHPWKRWELLLMARAMGNYSLNDYRTWLEPRVKSSLRRFFTWAIAATPVAPLNLAARLLVKYVFRKSPSITLYDLEESRNRRIAQSK